MIRLLIADDEKLEREALADMVSRRFEHEVVLELAENLVLGKQDLASTQLEDALHTMACKAAIRAGDKNDLSELQALAEEVFGNERIRHCPHGRPVLFELTRHEIEKQFKRV